MKNNCNVHLPDITFVKSATNYKMTLTETVCKNLREF